MPSVSAEAGRALMKAGSTTVSGDLAYSSFVDRSMHRTVETLFYFNPRQRALMEPIRRSIERFGSPEIVERGGRLSLGLPKLDAQCLFACDRSRHPGRPVGVVLYLRTEPDVLCILHLAVDPEYGRCGAFGDLEVASRLVNQVRELGRRIAGVRRVQLAYRPGSGLAVSGRERR